MDRLSFIKSCGIACVGGLSIAALQGCASSNYYAIVRIEDGKLVVNQSEFKYTDEDGIKIRSLVLARTTKYKYPICIYRNVVSKSGATEVFYNALLMECTHKGCELHAYGEFLVCPCHGSEFTNTGVVQNPPAEKNLRSFTVTTDSDNIYVHI